MADDNVVVAHTPPAPGEGRCGVVVNGTDHEGDFGALSVTAVRWVLGMRSAGASHLPSRPGTASVLIFENRDQEAATIGNPHRQIVALQLKKEEPGRDRRLPRGWKARAAGAGGEPVRPVGLRRGDGKETGGRCSLQPGSGPRQSWPSRPPVVPLCPSIALMKRAARRSRGTWISAVSPAWSARPRRL